MNKYLKLFDLDIPSDHDEYLEIWRSGSSRRPHDHPQYLQLMRDDKQHPYALVYYEDDYPKIAYVFYLIEVGDIISSNAAGVVYRHMISAYGYGGPILLDSSNSDFHYFELLLDDYLKNNNIVSEFVREDLFKDYKFPRKYVGVKQQDNVVVNLAKTKDELWNSFKYSVRKNVKRAQASNLEIRFDFDGTMTMDFVKVYHLTMERTNAKDFFMIPYDSFAAFNYFMKHDELGFYVHVLFEGKVIATELLLKSPRNIYSFLGGSNMNYANLRPSDFLKYEVCNWAIDNGLKGYVLGGGVKPYDGIYDFKLAFDLNGACSFFIQRNVHNINIYQKLIKERIDMEAVKGNAWEPRVDFFPAYLG